jgi:hypothetical protein
MVFDITYKIRDTAKLVGVITYHISPCGTGRTKARAFHINPFIGNIAFLNILQNIALDISFHFIKCQYSENLIFHKRVFSTYYHQMDPISFILYSCQKRRPVYIDKMKRKLPLGNCCTVFSKPADKILIYRRSVFEKQPK